MSRFDRECIQSLELSELVFLHTKYVPEALGITTRINVSKLQGQTYSLQSDSDPPCRATVLVSDTVVVAQLLPGQSKMPWCTGRDRKPNSLRSPTGVITSRLRLVPTVPQLRGLEQCFPEPPVSRRREELAARSAPRLATAGHPGRWPPFCVRNSRVTPHMAFSIQATASREKLPCSAAGSCRHQERTCSAPARSMRLLGSISGNAPTRIHARSGVAGAFRAEELADKTQREERYGVDCGAMDSSEKSLGATRGQSGDRTEIGVEFE